MAARRINLTIPTFEELNLPPILSKVALYPQGLVLICGITGSGKSTTLAAMIQHINSNRRCHIITIEDNFMIRYLDQVEERLKFWENEKRVHIAFDLSKTSYIDSSSISFIINFQKRVMQKNGKIVVFGPNEEVKEILTIVTFDQFVPVYNDRKHFEMVEKPTPPEPTA